MHAQCVQLFVTPTDCSLPGFTIHGIFRQEYWSGLPCPPPGDLPDPGIKPMSPALVAGFFYLSLSHLGIPEKTLNCIRRGISVYAYVAFPGSIVIKNPPASAGDIGLIPGSGRSLEKGNDKPLQYSCLKIPWTKEPSRLEPMGSQTVECI